MFRYAIQDLLMKTSLAGGHKRQPTVSVYHQEASCVTLRSNKHVEYIFFLISKAKFLILYCLHHAFIANRVTNWIQKKQEPACKNIVP